MPISTIESEPMATDIVFSDVVFRVSLDDGRQLSVPVAWFPRLMHGTSEQRWHLELIGLGRGVHWPELDEDISVAGILAGRRDRSILRHAVV